VYGDDGLFFTECSIRCRARSWGEYYTDHSFAARCSFAITDGCTCEQPDSSRLAGPNGGKP
jgi:hypothetical protein